MSAMTIEDKVSIKVSEKTACKMLPIMSAVTGNLIWGFSNVLTQIALYTAKPSVVLSIRFLLAVIVMSGLIAIGKETLNLLKPGLAWLLLLGVIELLYFYCESYGIVYTNVTFSGVILAETSIVAILLATIFLKEIPTVTQVFFSMVTVIGVVLITMLEKSTGVIQLKGVGLLLAGCIVSAIFRIVNRKISNTFSVFERTYVVLLFSAIGFTISAIHDTRENILELIMPFEYPSFVISVVVLGICSSVGANMMINYAVKKMTVVKISVFSSISTICSMLGGIIFLHEPFSYWAIIGIIMIVIGIYQVNK